MSINDGNPVNADYTNERLASKQEDNVLEGKQALEHNNIESGANVLDVQKTLNDLIAMLAAIGTGNTVSNIGGAVGELFKQKTGIDLEFRTVAGTKSVNVVLNGDVLEVDHPVEFLAVDPVAPVANQLWFNANDKVWRFFDGLTTTEIGGDYVALTGNQTVAGEKTWSDDAYFSQDVQITGKLIVQGDMQVDGTLTWVNTTDLEVTDNNITINKGGNDATAEGAGFNVERDSANGCFQFDSALDTKWKIGLAGDCKEIGTLVKGTEVAILGLGSYSTSVRYYATDTGKHYLYDAVKDELLEIGSGSGGVGSPSIYGIFNAEDEDVTDFTNIAINSTNPIASTRDYSVTGFPCNFPDVDIQNRNRNKENSVRFHYSLASGSFKALVKDESANVLRELIISETGTAKPVSIEFPVTAETTVTLHLEDVSSATGVRLDDVVFDDDPFKIKDLIESFAHELDTVDNFDAGTGYQKYINTSYSENGGVVLDNTGAFTRFKAVKDSYVNIVMNQLGNTNAGMSFRKLDSSDVLLRSYQGQIYGAAGEFINSFTGKLLAGESIVIHSATNLVNASDISKISCTGCSVSGNILSTAETSETSTKNLTANVNSTGVISDLTQTLEVGKLYYINAHFNFQASGLCQIAVKNGTINVGAIESIDNNEGTRHWGRIFRAVDTQLTFDVLSLSGGQIQGGVTNGFSATYCQATNLTAHFLAAIPKNYSQTKVMGSNDATGDLDFNNLIIGKFYRVDMSAYCLVNNNNVSLRCEHDGNLRANVEFHTTTTNNENNGASDYAEFKATATTVVFSKGGTGVIFSGSKATLTELNYTEETDRF